MMFIDSFSGGFADSKPKSDFSVAFYIVSRKHELTLAQQARCREIVTEQHTISLGTIWELMEDWFARIGLRFRIKMRLYRRIIADALQRRRASYSVS